MGFTHATSGTAAWFAVTAALPAFGPGIAPLEPAGVLAGAMVCAGAALLPDADHHNATIAHSLPPLSNAVCAGVGTLSGGHRQGTHSLIGIAVFTLIAWLAGMVALDTEMFGTIYPAAGLLS